MKNAKSRKEDALAHIDAIIAASRLDGQNDKMEAAWAAAKIRDKDHPDIRRAWDSSFRGAGTVRQQRGRDAAIEAMRSIGDKVEIFCGPTRFVVPYFERPLNTLRAKVAKWPMRYFA